MNWQNEFESLKETARQGVPARSHSGLVEAGDIFVAVKGTAVDGAAFIPGAVEKGAAYVVCEDVETAKAAVLEKNGSLGSTVFLSHPDPRIALGDLAAAYYGTEKKPFPIVGVTGTNGKTTVTYLVEHLFKNNGKSVGVLGTVSYRWGGKTITAPQTTPGCVLIHEYFAEMAKAGVDLAVMEVSSHALDQSRAAGIPFAAGVVTNVTQDHLDYHGDMESYFAAKTKLFTEVLLSDKAAVVNWDDAYGRRLIEQGYSGFCFGLNEPPAGVDGLQGRILSCEISGLQMEMHWKGQVWQLHSKLVGKYNASNLLAAQAVGLSLGLQPEQMQALSDFSGAPGRLERVDNPKGYHVFVDYAHSPDALENVLAALKELAPRKVITVFGCGGDRDKTKRPLMGQAVCKYSDLVVLTSDNPRTEDPIAIMNDIRPGLSCCTQVIETPDRKLGILTALTEMHTGDVLLVAGKGHEDYQVLGTKKVPFSDQKVVREYFG